MALSEVALPILFRGGVDTKSDSKSVASTQLIALENGMFDKGTTIVKRTGYDGLSREIDDGSGLYTLPKAIAARGNELVLFADDQMFSFRESSGTWNRAGRAQSIVHTERVIAATSTDQSMPDSATISGITVAAWEDSRGGVWWSVVELESGRMLRQAEALDSSAERPRVIVCGDRIHVYYTTPAVNRIFCVVVNPSAYQTAPSPQILVGTLSSTNPTYDAVRLDPAIGQGGAMAWALSTGGYQVAFIDPSGVIGSAVTGWPTSVPWPLEPIDGPIAVISSDAQTPFVGVAYVSTNSALLRLLDATDLAVSLIDVVVAGTTTNPGIRITAIAGAPGESLAGAPYTDVWVFVEEGADPLVLNGRDNSVHFGWIDDSGGVVPAHQAPAPLRGHGLVSRAFYDDGAAYVMVAHEVSFFPYVALMRGYVADPSTSLDPTAVCVGRLIVGTSDGLPERGHLTTVEADDDDVRIHRWIGCSREQVDADPAGAQFTETRLTRVTMDFDSPDAFQTVEFGPDLIVAGALPLRYDGDQVAELGFHTAPDGVIGTVAAAGGSLTESSTYLYTFAYEETDAAGVIHPGPMSIGTLVTLAAGQTRVTLTIPTYRITSKRRVRIAVFRSEANDTNDQPDMFRVSSLNPSASTGSNRYIVNDTSIDTVSFVDDLSDIELLKRERAYTNGGALSNDPVGLAHVVAGGKERLFFLDPTDPNVVRFTQSRRDGFGPEVCADLSIRFDQAGGDIGALGVLDDALLAFKERTISFTAGPGPLPNPDAAPQIGFAAPAQLPSEDGCTTPRSVVVAADRIFFQAANGAGIKQVGRDRTVSYVGAPVEAYNAQRITSADVIPGTDRVIFLTDEGRTLLFDHFHGQWSTWTNHEGLDATLIGNVYHYLRANSGDYRVFRSNSGYLDASTSILLYLETAWIKLQQYHQGLQKIWHALILGQYKSSHVLSVKVATDYRPGWDEPYYIEADASYTPAPYGDGPYGEGLYGGESDTVYQQRIHVGAKCQAIRFAIGETMGGEFSQTPPTGASFELTELLLTGGAMRPSQVFGAARSH